MVTNFIFEGRFYAAEINDSKIAFLVLALFILMLACENLLVFTSRFPFCCPIRYISGQREGLQYIRRL